jgi:two-component system chemotaxis sensor kinase CheA
MDKNAEFLKKLLATFKVEAEEHVRALSSGLLELEAAPEAARAELVETIFREAHSLKGAARAVNVTEVERVCQSLESVFSVLKRREIALSRLLLDRLHKGVDTVAHLLAPDGSGRSEAEKSAVAEVTRSLEEAANGALPEQQEERKRARGEDEIPAEHESGLSFGKTSEFRPAEAKPAVAGTVRISMADMDLLLRQAEELLAAKLAAAQHVAELRQVGAALAGWEKGRAKIQHNVRAIQQSLEKGASGNGRIRPADDQEKTLSQMARVLAFVESNDRTMEFLKAELAKLTQSAERDGRSLRRWVDGLMEEMKKVSMLPFSTVLEVLPKMVRDISHEQGKDVTLLIQGGEIKTDKRILEEMKDPLLHLVRNSVDHGIESGDERERKGKSSRGTITITISPQDGDKVEIRVSDDGAGLDLAKVRAAAVKLGAVSQVEAGGLSEQDAAALVFHSGVSTSSILTEISGRGLGLAIVREKVEKLGGTVSLETQAGAGTTFRIILPRTLATFRGILVSLEKQLFVLPSAHVDRVVRLRKDEIRTAENQETMRLGGQSISLVRLRDLLKLACASAENNEAAFAHIVVLGWASQRIGFLVDEVLSEDEVLVKSLGRQLSRVRNIAGAAVLGGGKVVPVLNVPDLMQSAVTAASTNRPAALEGPRKQHSILVAEDSITARTLLKNILESAGYQVKTAVDGEEAFAALSTAPCDLVVSDIEMPRMNGFDLTARIRADKKFAELPVVLVTSLQSREDRERGVEAGANAYIVKSSFDQSNLLEIIRRLI